MTVSTSKTQMNNIIRKIFFHVDVQKYELLLILDRKFLQVSFVPLIIVQLESDVSVSHNGANFKILEFRLILLLVIVTFFFFFFFSKPQAYDRLEFVLYFPQNNYDKCHRNPKLFLIKFLTKTNFFRSVSLPFHYVMNKNSVAKPLFLQWPN